ncbi:MAG: hypothetical protein KGS61_20575 [Verrucomicrobia bacterium]|nr:hypothetical protein [Verrucomicrobiota bacterium]
MSLRRKLVCAAVVPALLLLGTGCGGFSASPAVSPGMFFLPGLGQAPANPPAAPAPVTDVAFNANPAASR